MALRFRTLDFRTIDGSNNNLADPTLNQAGTDFARVGPANFADGFNEMTPGPNPREISNIVVAQEDAGEDGPHLTDDNGVALSGMMYAWGQFIDHDLDLQKSDTTKDISIPIPADDPFLSGSIPLTRVAIDPATGVPGKPASHQYGHGLAGRITDIRIGRRHRSEPADSRRSYEGVGGR